MLKKGQVPHEELFSLEKAHDVRRLRTCRGCKGMGDSKTMIQDDTGPWADAYWHGRCFADLFGVEELVKLPARQTNNLSLGDLGVVLMKKLIRRG